MREINVWFDKQSEAPSGHRCAIDIPTSILNVKYSIGFYPVFCARPENRVIKSAVVLFQKWRIFATLADRFPLNFPAERAR